MGKYKKSADEPISHSVEDRFGRKDFSRALGESLLKVPNSQSITVGLYGPWGSGKTSVINMATEYLTNKYEDKVVIVNFNPWVFSNAESLHRAFFGTLANALGKSLRTNGQKIAGELEKYGELTSSLGVAVGVLFPHLSIPAAIIGKASAKIFKSAGAAHNGRNADVDAIRKRLNELLKASGVRVVVVVDDIDRLDSDEVHQIFRLVKNVAHFNNVSYLLSFDREVVKQVLANRYPENPKVGGDFIDKIVQLPLHIPSVEPEQLSKYLTTEIDRIIATHKLNVPEDDISRFQSVYYVKDAARLFTTPRQVIRYLNTLDFSLERLGDEASFTDVALIDLLRVFYPKIYENLPELKEVVLRRGSYGDRGDEAKLRVRERVFGTKEPHGLEVTIISELFPSAEWAFGGVGYSDNFEAVWEETKRVCTDKYFARYFAYGFPPGDIPDSRIEKFLETILSEKTTVKHANKLFTSLIKNADTTRIISKLRRKEEKLLKEQSSKLAQVLADQGASLPRTRQSIAGDMMSPYIQSAILAVHLTRNVEEPVALLKEMLAGSPINYAAELLRWVRVNSENDKKERDADFVPLLTGAQVQELGEQLAVRIKKYATSHYLQRDFPEDVPQLMWAWHKWGSKDDINKYFERSFKRDSKLTIEFLMAYLGKGYEIESGKPVRTDFRKDLYNSIAEMVDPRVLVVPLIKEFGEDISGTDEYPENIYHEDKSYEYNTAAQFLYLHRKAEQEARVGNDSVIEGEVIDG